MPALDDINKLLIERVAWPLLLSSNIICTDFHLLHSNTKMEPSMSSLEAESGCAEPDGSTAPLLSDYAGDEEDVDEEIVSQLLSASNKKRSSRRRCQQFVVSKSLWGSLIAVFALMGLFASVWATCSCNLVAVKWNEGGVELSISAVGIWSYEQEVVVQSNKDIGAISSDDTTKKGCVDYGAKQHAEAGNMQDFFPSNTALQVYSILGPSLYFAAILMLVCMAIMLFFQSETDVYPDVGVTVAVALSAVFFVLSCIFQLLSIQGILHSSNNDDSTDHQSPICNPTYSHCNLGPGGHWAVFGMCGSFICGLGSMHLLSVATRGNGLRDFWK